MRQGMRGDNAPRESMSSAIARVTGKCNQACIFCCQQGRNWAEDPELETVKRDIDSLKSQGAEVLTFMQGETLLRKDITAIIAYARKAGFTRIGIATNGTLLSNRGYLNELVEKGVMGFEFSIHSHDPEKASEISGRSFTHRRQAQALENIAAIRKNVRFFFNTVICAQNADSLDKLAEYLAGFFPPEEIIINLKFPFLMGRAEKNPSVAPKYSELNLAPLFDYAGKNGIDIRLENFPLCAVPGHEHKVMKTIDLARGNEYFSRGGGKDDEYRNMGLYAEGYTQAPACAGCSLRAICAGFDNRYIKTYGSGEARPSTKSPVEIVSRIINK